MALLIKKTFPISVEPIEAYLKVTNVFYREDKKNRGYDIQYSIFLTKASSDLIKSYLYFKTVWPLKLENKKKFIPVVLEYLEDKFAKSIPETTPLQEAGVYIPDLKPIYEYELHDNLMSDVYKWLWDVLEFEVIGEDLETEPEFRMRIID